MKHTTALNMSASSSMRYIYYLRLSGWGFSRESQKIYSKKRNYSTAKITDESFVRRKNVNELAASKVQTKLCVQFTTRCVADLINF